MRVPIVPDREGFGRLAGQGNLIPVYAEILADIETPVSAYMKLGGLGDRFLLESAEHGERFARYSFVGAGPTVVFRAKGGRVTIVERGVESQFDCPDDPLKALERLMSRYRPVSPSRELPLFYGGAVGFLAYESVRYFEKTVPAAERDDLDVPDLYYIITDSLLIFDHLKRTLKIVANAFVDDDPGSAYDGAREKITQILGRLGRPTDREQVHTLMTPEDVRPSMNMAREDYIRMTSRMKEYIGAGDIFQVVPSQRFEVPYGGRPIDLYRALRSINPSPYMFCLEFGDLAIVGSSPETHVRCEEGRVAIRPIAGTRPVSQDPDKDAAMETELLANEKERAEHVMLVDLARNDLGRVCEYDTVRVPEFMVVERYSHVMHIVSHVVGKLAGRRSSFDVMRATFPAGTVSGSPKVRAMQIIAEQEPTCRGIYAGAVGYFSFSGNLDSCIAIRTIVVKGGVAYLQAGGGLVADSTPEGEYQESISKARAGLRALGQAMAGTKRAEG